MQSFPEKLLEKEQHMLMAVFILYMMKIVHIYN